MTKGFVQKEYENFAEQIEDERVKANIHRDDLGSFMKLLFGTVLYNIVTLEDCTSYADLVRVCKTRYPRISEWVETHRHQCESEIRNYTCDPIPSLANLYANKNCLQEEKMRVLDTYASYTNGMAIEEILKTGHLCAIETGNGEKLVIARSTRDWKNFARDTMPYDVFCKDQGKQLETIGQAMILSVYE